jgi:uncharacterized protein (TIGR03083 family)
MPFAITHDPADVRAACVRQWLGIAEAVERIPDHAFELGTRLPGWRVAELVAHLTSCVDALTRRLSEPMPPTVEIDLSGYLLSMRSVAAVIEERELAAATGTDPDDQRRRFRTAVSEMAIIVERTHDRLVATRFGCMRLVDFIATRCIEGVVHGLDIAHTLPAVALVPDPGALKLTTKALLAALATKAPGRAVEVRVPPVAAVQCVDGPRHTRGTPPSVVETDPLTWIELAAGRLPWREPRDDGRLRASGERSDLHELLPLF